MLLRQTSTIGATDDEATDYIEYLASPNLGKVTGPGKQAKKIPEMLRQSGWKEQIAGCTMARRIAINHTDTLIMNSSLCSEIIHGLIAVS